MRPSDKWLSSPVRYGEAMSMNDMEGKDVAPEEDNPGYIKSKHTLITNNGNK